MQNGMFKSIFNKRLKKNAIKPFCRTKDTSCTAHQVQFSVQNITLHHYITFSHQNKKNSLNDCSLPKWYLHAITNILHNLHNTQFAKRSWASSECCIVEDAADHWNLMYSAGTASLQLQGSRHHKYPFYINLYLHLNLRKPYLNRKEVCSCGGKLNDRI